MESLSRDMRRLLASYLTLREKRALLQVSKWCYWWMKPYVKITTVPSGGLFGPGQCKVCENRVVPRKKHRHRSTLSHRTPCDLFSTEYAECERGHRFICHVMDKNVAFNCPICTVKKIKR